jgi:hypothetical protein
LVERRRDSCSTTTSSSSSCSSSRSDKVFHTHTHTHINMTMMTNLADPKSLGWIELAPAADTFQALTHTLTHRMFSFAVTPCHSNQPARHLHIACVVGIRPDVASCSSRRHRQRRSNSRGCTPGPSKSRSRTRTAARRSTILDQFLLSRLPAGEIRSTLEGRFGRLPAASALNTLSLSRSLIGC